MTFEELIGLLEEKGMCNSPIDVAKLRHQRFCLDSNHDDLYWLNGFLSGLHAIGFLNSDDFFYIFDELLKRY